MKWLISYKLFINNNFGTSSKCTEIIDVEPSKWWENEYWQTARHKWDGCLILMVHKIKDLVQDHPLVMGQSGTSDGDRAVRAINKLQAKNEQLETCLRYAAGQLSGAVASNHDKHPEEVYDELLAYRS